MAIDKIRCEVQDGRRIQISNFIKEPYSPEEGIFIEFGVKGFRMPSSSRPTGSITVQTKDIFVSGKFLVDSSTLSDLLRATPGDLYDVDVWPATNETYYYGLYKIDLKTGNEITKGGAIRVTFPQEMDVGANMTCTELGSAEATCVA